MAHYTCCVIAKEDTTKSKQRNPADIIMTGMGSWWRRNLCTIKNVTRNIYAGNFKLRSDSDKGDTQYACAMWYACMEWNFNMTMSHATNKCACNVLWMCTRFLQTKNERRLDESEDKRHHNNHSFCIHCQLTCHINCNKMREEMNTDCMQGFSFSSLGRACERTACAIAICSVWGSQR